MRSPAAGWHRRWTAVNLGRWYPAATVLESRLSPDGRAVAELVEDRAGIRLVLHDREGRHRSTTRRPGADGAAWLGDSSGLAVLGADDATTWVELVLLDGPRPPRRRWQLDGDITRAHFVDADLSRSAGPLLWIERAGDPDHCEFVAVRGEGPQVVLRTGRMDRVVLDVQGHPRLGVRWRADGSQHLFSLSGSAVSLELSAPPGVHTHPDVAVGDTVMVSAPAPDGFLGWGRLDLTTGTFTPVVTDRGADVEEVVLGPDGEPTAARLAGRRDRWIGLDHQAAADLAWLGARLDTWQLLGRSADDRCWLLEVETPQQQPRRLVWRRDERRLVGIGGTDRRAGRPSGLRGGPPTDLVVTARDGLELVCRLTGVAGGRPQPTVLLVHGGPWHRTGWAWDPERAWLAAAGYLVVEPDFRGSDGRGVEFARAGDRDWGGAMQDDLADCLDHVVAAGLADPRRCHVMGTSYGGYAALMEVTGPTRRLASAVAIAPATDLVRMTRDLRDAGGFLGACFAVRVGDPDVDAEQLLAQSPLARSGEVHAPVLLVHGTADGVFSVDHSLRFAAALSEAGRAHRVRLFPGEGHGITSRTNQLRLGREILRFLAAAER